MIIGLAYKPNVDDMRESPTFHLFDLLKAAGAEVAYYDPHIPVVGPTREHAAWQGLSSIKWSRRTIQSFDMVLISTNHKDVNYQQLADWCQGCVDTRNAMSTVKIDPKKIWKA